MKTRNKFLLFSAAAIALTWAAASCAFCAQSGSQPGEPINYGKSFDDGRTAENTRFQNRMLELGQEMREVQQMAQLHRTECVTLHRSDAQGAQSCIQAARKEEDEKSLDHQTKMTAEQIHHDRIMLALRTHWNGR